MSRHRMGNCDFDVVGLPSKEVINPIFFDDTSVEWRDDTVTEATVKDAERVECNGVPIPIGDLTDEILRHLGKWKKEGNQFSRHWTWKGKKLYELHRNVHASREVASLLWSDFNQALPTTFRAIPYEVQAQTLAFALCFAVTAIVLAADKSSYDIAEEGVFAEHIIDHILPDALHGVIPHEDLPVFKAVFDEYCQALQKGNIVDCNPNY